ncbi:hypothetical protein [Pseudonocardia humida]|uniref:Type III secretion system (T3SS) SseB-like protein n=1 Tax=Pseudonocardia humida TaxID=2800819 RepID=A0ABT1AC52_9PSEU|nr:hypothetical protein [Pseudonocardia humida]MCO1660568.1 hypothetical protein [Pseudonocardia humida]
MHARFQTTRTEPPPDLAGRVEELVDLIGTHPGFAGAWLLPAITAGAGGLLTLWRTREDAELASERTAAVSGPRPVALDGDAIYRVAADMAGTAAEREPAVAQLVHFDAPRTDDWSAAMLRAGRERIWPAVRDVPGAVRSLSLVGDGNAHLVVNLAATVEAVDAAQRLITTTALLPWEDPAALTGPDRIDLHRVAAHRAAAPSRA